MYAVDNSRVVHKLNHRKENRHEEVLKLKFKTAEDKTSMITVRYPKQDLSAETVKSAMQKIVDAAALKRRRSYLR
ncbi:DUF2922 domain-containing protein [Lactobacillus johnsonii]|uniref:DUF2922 domain-containing protein n=1 Tax=Lactobacillus johnsonii TaxID=33959 RepID=UPI003AAB831A